VVAVYVPFPAAVAGILLRAEEVGIQLPAMVAEVNTPPAGVDPIVEDKV
jgi:hypothetical protein